ncbi:MAG: hypothetical protein JWP89_2706 [Schlesneria sp.]|nr:hypothetical protein [Schlesneria sp.]
MITMTIHEAAETLAAELSGFKWFVSLGVGNPNGIQTIYVYVKSLRHPQLAGLRDGYQGFPVVIENTGVVRPANSSF